MKTNRKKWILIAVVLAIALLACSLLVLLIRGLFFSGQQPAPFARIGTLVQIPASGGSGGQSALPTPTGPAIAITPGPLTDVETFPSLATLQPGLPPCENILYPLAVGKTWTYRVTARDKTYLVDMRVASVDGSQAVVDLSPQALGINTRAVIDCDAGSLHNLPWTAVWMLVDDVVNGSLAVDYLGGQLAPSHADFLGSGWDLAWSGEYRMDGDGSARFQGNDYSLSLDQEPLHLDCRTAGSGQAAFEALVVPAGSFTSALKVICTFETQASMSYNGMNLNGKVRGELTQWFAPFLGMLKMQVDSASIRYLLVDIPVNVSGAVELIDYQDVP